MPDMLNSIFWIEVEKIKPNRLQPRQEFNEDRLRDLSESIRQYGVLQPLVVTKREVSREDGSFYSEYELIAGERRWRASRLAGLNQVPCVIRTGEDDDRLSLEMAIIENLQREDLNPVDRARAFERLTKEFKLKHHHIAKKVGKSREYVTNSLRILGLNDEFLEAIVAGKITEGHTRPLLMLSDRPAEQRTLFDQIITQRLTVRDAEGIARRQAVERVRKTEINAELIAIERDISERLGTRVQIEKRGVGGRVTINYLSESDLQNILNILAAKQSEADAADSALEPVTPAPPSAIEPEPEEELEDDLYNIKNFSL